MKHVVEFVVTDRSFVLELEDDEITPEKLIEIGCQFVRDNVAGVPVSIDGEPYDED